MKSIKLLLCVLLTAMSFNIFADEIGRYQMQALSQDSAREARGVYILDTKTGEVKNCNVMTQTGVYCLPNKLSTSVIKVAQ